MKKLLLLSTCILIIVSCNNELIDDQFLNNPEENSNQDDIVFQENFGNTAIGNFEGLVTDKSGTKLSGVQITIGNSVVLTDRNGMFVINNANVYENFAYIKARKTGYINGSRVVVPKTEGVNKIRIVLLDKEVTASVNSGESSQVSLSNGAKVSFGGAFIKADGTEYNGQVDVVMHYVAPNTVNTFTQMPGALFAQSNTNDARSLETYGMLSVNLFSPSGEQLNINEQSPATIEFPVDYSQSAIAPETINLWYFDEEVGYWKEEGEANKVGDTYVAEVTHFSWWNCDLPLEFVELCFSLTPENNASVAYYVLINRVINNQLIFSGIVLSGDGLECGIIPEDEEIEISIYAVGIDGACYGNLLHQQLYGGYTSNTGIDISFTDSGEVSTTTITGNITNCAGNPLTDGYVYVDGNNTYSVTDGILNFGVQHCTNVEIVVQVFDFDTHQWTTPISITLNEEELDLGMLSTCEDTGGVYNGDVILYNQEEVNFFGLFNYTSINGYLIIGNNSTNTDITDVTPLSALEEVQEFMQISNNVNLQSLQGLNSLVSVNDNLYIGGNASLVSFSGLNNLTTIGSLRITFNSQLESLTGLSSLSVVNHIYLTSNYALTSLNGLGAVMDLDVLNIKDNTSLNTINALQNLSTLNQLFIDGNAALTTLTGLEQITEAVYIWIANNEFLTDLNGLENLENIIQIPNANFPSISIGLMPNDTGSEDIAPNPSLSDFCSLENLFVNGNGTSVEVLIDNNAYNPTVQDIIDGNCAQ